MVLTSLASGAGCGCKLPASALLPALAGLPAPSDPRLRVGSATSDDAAVFCLSEEVALVQTIDIAYPVAAPRSALQARSGPCPDISRPSYDPV